MATHSHFASICAATLLVLAGSVASAEAQTAGNRSSTPPGAGSSGNTGRVLLYGTPENCPPTIACEPRQPKKIVPLPRCDRWEYVQTSSGRRIRRCLER